MATGMFVPAMECMGCAGGRSHPMGLVCMSVACAAPARPEGRGRWWSSRWLWIGRPGRKGWLLLLAGLELLGEDGLDPLSNI
jgi:hypothetical protein